MVQTISVSDLKTLLDPQATFALIDVREPGEYNASHIPGSSLVPRRQLEFRMLRLVPYRGTLLIVTGTICATGPWRGGWRGWSWNMVRIAWNCPIPRQRA